MTKSIFDKDEWEAKYATEEDMKMGEQVTYNNYAKKRLEDANKKLKGLSKRGKRGLIVLGTVAVGCGLYGFGLGRTFSYKRGFRDGEIFANDQFRYLANEMIETIKKSEGK